MLLSYTSYPLMLSAKFINNTDNMDDEIIHSSQIGNIDNHTSCQGKITVLLQSLILQFYASDMVGSSELKYLYFSAVTSILFCLLYLVLEVVQLVRRKKKYLEEYENYIQVVMFVLCIIFTLPTHDDWCFPKWKWGVGAIAVFLAWLNCILILKSMPVIGESITTLLYVYWKFIKLIYLPIFLVLTFGFPFYMLLVNDTGFEV